MIIDPKKFDFQWQGASNACSAFACWHAWKIQRPQAAALVSPVQLHKLEQLKRYPNAAYDSRKSSSLLDVLGVMVREGYISGFNRTPGCSLELIDSKLAAKIPLVVHLFKIFQKQVVENHVATIVGHDASGITVLDSSLRLARVRKVKPDDVFLLFELLF